MRRPDTYRRPGPWMLALRRLNALGASDGQIALLLSHLPDHAILLLEASRHWSLAAAEDALDPDADARPWTARQVRYHRRQMGLPAVGKPPDVNESLRLRRDVLAAHQGWGHLVNRGREIRAMLANGDDPGDVAARIQWTRAALDAWLDAPWDGLTPTETRLLTALDEHGRQTRTQLMQRLGLPYKRHWHDGKTSWLGRLLAKRLVSVAGYRYERRIPRRYWQVAEGITRRIAEPRSTSFERLMLRLENAVVQESSGRK